MLRPFWLAAFLLLPLAACDSLSEGDQALFEDQAYLTAPGTATAWRVGPAFDARMRLLQPPTPNPASSGTEVALLLDVDVAVPGGFELRRVDADGSLLLVTDVQGFGSPYIYTVSFLARQVDPLARSGVYRLVLLDRGGRVVAYGDFELRT